MKALTKSHGAIKLLGITGAIYCAAGIISESIRFFAYRDDLPGLFFTATIWNAAEYLLAIPFLIGLKLGKVWDAISLFFCGFLVYQGLAGPFRYIASAFVETGATFAEVWPETLEVIVHSAGALIILAFIIKRWPYKKA